MKLLKWIDRNIEEVILVILLILMTVLLFIQVVFRFLLHLPLAWTEEISLYSMVWLCYFGASLAIRNRAHLRVEILMVFLTKRHSKVLDIIADVLFLIFAVVILVISMKLIGSLYSYKVTTAVLKVPKWIPYGGMPLAFLMMVIRLVQDIKRCCGELKELTENNVNA